MKKNIAILYSDSHFTPWNENVDLSTAVAIANSITPNYNVNVVHMMIPNENLADLLRTFDCVINICYGFKHLSQADIAVWLDDNGINHITTKGNIQLIAQDKRAVEELMVQFELPVVKSVFSKQDLLLNKFDHYIVKPIFGGCHRDISIYSVADIIEEFDYIDLNKYLVQPYLTGREFSVAVVPCENLTEYQALYPVEIIPFPPRNLFIAGQQYGQTKKDFTPTLTPELEFDLKNTSILAHQLLGLEYLCRIDFRLFNNQLYILDVNTMPNLHPVKSLLPSILKYHNIEFNKLIKNLVEMNFKKSQRSHTLSNSESLN